MQRKQRGSLVLFMNIGLNSHITATEMPGTPQNVASHLFALKCKWHERACSQNADITNMDRILVYYSSCLCTNALGRSFEILFIVESSLQFLVRGMGITCVKSRDLYNHVVIGKCKYCSKCRFWPLCLAVFYKILVQHMWIVCSNQAFVNWGSKYKRHNVLNQIM